jgi:hypothetical protein
MWSEEGQRALERRGEWAKKRERRANQVKQKVKQNVK